MQRLITLAVAIAVVVLLASGIALAQEELLPDLTVDKTGPSTATPAPDEFVIYSIDVTNVGSGDAVLPSGAVLVRDEVRSHAGIFQGSTTGNFRTIEGVTGLPVGIDLQFPPGGTRTRLLIDMVNPERESSDAIISPGGALRQAPVGVDTKASGGYIINCATVDPDNVIVESDESNNTECVTTKIVP
jgi:hypothetical protein